MTTRYHIGAKALRGAIGAYGKRFGLLEVQVAATPDSTSSQVRTNPALATLRKWRRDVPPAFEFSVVTGPALSRLKPGPELDRDLEAAIAAVQTLRARCLLIRTPADVTPGSVSRQRMKALLERLPKDATYIVWEPSGPWDIETAAVAALEWQVTLAVDPSRDPVPRGDVAYGRLRALGETRSFGPSALARVVRAIGDRRDAFVVLDTDSALNEAKRLRALLSRPKSSEDGDAGMLLRPRGVSMLRTEEEEE
jgi:uncharacterized protein YecE (DUF72 family)